MATELIEQTEKNQYVFLQDGDQVGVTGYQRRGDALYLTHTEVDPDRRGQGIADAMVRAVFDDIRSKGNLSVVAACPFVVEWLERNPDDRDLERKA
jgi:predicted GNAT family acetyltransferase